MADAAEQKSLIEHFRAVAGVNEERARFFLESTDWNLDLALAAFFDNDGGEGGMSPHFESAQVSPPPPRHVVDEGKSSGKSSSSVKPPSQSSRFATIGSLRTEESESSEEEGQAYYAGGSERGAGQQIIGPSKKKKANVDTLVSGMFKAAKDHGAEVVEPSSGASSAGGQPSSFGGRAYRLGDNQMESEVIDNSNRVPQHRQVEMVLKLWQNGFSVDNGPLRDFHDPASKKFLQEIQKGEIPQELIQQARGSEVHLNMEDHRDEEYVKPPVVVKPFTGEGHRLGCPSDPVTVANESARAMAGSGSAPSAAAGSSRESVAAAILNVDQSQPITSLQIRLADGSRLVVKFNHVHRIADVRQYIITARPEYATANFVLMTTFPNAELTNEALSLADANLLNAVLVQRLK